MSSEWNDWSSWTDWKKDSNLEASTTAPSPDSSTGVSSEGWNSFSNDKKDWVDYSKEESKDSSQEKEDKWGENKWGDSGEKWGDSKKDDNSTWGSNNAGGPKKTGHFKDEREANNPIEYWERDNSQDKKAVVDVKAREFQETSSGTFIDEKIACSDKVFVLSEAHKGDTLECWDTWEKCAGLPEALIKLMTDGRIASYARPTTIQAYVWPALMQKEDIIAVAKTGSGKTLAFLIPAFLSCKLCDDEFQSGKRRSSPHVLILAPTRELCNQIFEEAKKFGTPAGIRTAVAYGGTENRKQQEWMMSSAPHIVAACPGRMLDFVNKDKCDLSLCEILVLDECDRMLDMGFEWELRSLMGKCSEDRQSLLFSATFPKSLKAVADRLCHSDALHIQVGTEDPLTGNKDVFQVVKQLENEWEKINTLYKIVNEHREGDNWKDDFKMLVFCRSKRSCSELCKQFSKKYGIPAGELHGDLDQRNREWSLSKFQSGESRLLFATDVASRGLDIKNVAAVCNYDPADCLESHVHRIGRTGRAGAKGTAYTLIGNNELYYINNVVQTMLKAGQEVDPALMKTAREWAKNW